MEFRLPELGEGVYEAEMVRWLVNCGDTVKPGQTLLEVLTDKATMEVPAPFAGTIQSLLVEPGQKLTIGQAILTHDGKTSSPSPKAEQPISSSPLPKGEGPISSSPLPKGEGPGVRVAPAAAPSPSTRNHAVTTPTPTAIKAAPSIRLLARKLGIDLQKVQGSGPAGRILIDDLPSHVAPPDSRAAVIPAPTVDYGTPGTRIKLQGLRRKIAEHMVLSKRTIPHYTYVDECDVTDLVKLRDSLKEAFTRQNTKITYLAFLVKAVVAALKEVPMVNASMNDEAGEIVLHGHYHIGMAVATPGGLIVPVIHDADKKTLLAIARDIERLSGDARLGKSRLEDLRGGTFTITSIGNIGGLFATPIIAYPQVGILGVGKIVKRPVFDAQSQIKAADMVYLSWSFDHRVVDGAVGTAFGNAVIRQLQNPAALLME